MSMIFFLADLMRDPKGQEAFAKDPRTLMKQAGLDDRQIDLIWQGDVAGVGAEMAREIRDFVSGRRLPYPSSTVEVRSISPAQGAAGSTVSATVEGLFFADGATCRLKSGSEVIVGQVASVTSSFLSTMAVTFQIPADASPGKWTVEVANTEDSRDGLDGAFEIAAPAAST
jgi:hypothetical protein